MNPSTWRRLGAFALLPLAGTFLAACGSDDDGGSSGGSGSKTITFAYQIANPDAKSPFETLAKEYETTHEGVTIKTNPIVLNTYGSTITTQLQAGSGPDVFYINAGTGQAGSVGTLGKAGKLLDLTGKVEDSAIPDNAKAALSYDDKVVAVPVYLAPAGLIYSPDAASASGFTLDASSTMDDVMAQCQKVAGGGKAVFGLAGSMAPNTGIFTAEIAASTVYGPEPDWNQQRADGETTFAESQGWQDALQAVKDLYDNKCFQEGAAGAGFDALTNGAGQGLFAAFAAPGGAAKDIMDSTGGAVTLQVQAMPAPEGYETYLMAGTADAISVNKASKNTDLATDFVSWMSEPAQIKAMADAAGDIPVGDTDTSTLLPQYEPVAGLIADGKIAQYPYIEWPNGEVYNALGTGVTGLLTGQMSVDDVLTSMDDAWDAGS